MDTVCSIPRVNVRFCCELTHSLSCLALFHNKHAGIKGCTPLSLFHCCHISKFKLMPPQQTDVLIFLAISLAGGSMPLTAFLKFISGDSTRCGHGRTSESTGRPWRFTNWRTKPSLHRERSRKMLKSKFRWRCHVVLCVLLGFVLSYTLPVQKNSRPFDYDLGLLQLVRSRPYKSAEFLNVLNEQVILSIRFFLPW